MFRHKDFLIVLIRLFLGYIFLSAGLCKLTHGHFGQIIGPPLLEDALARYGLALFARVVATLQVICGLLLLSQRYSTIAAIMLMPMNLSILAVTVSMQWTGTPYVNGFFILLNILLLLYDWPKLKVLINPAYANAVTPTITDRYGNNIYNFVGLAFGTVALISSRFNIILTNSFAVAAFVIIGYSVVQVKAITNLQRLIAVLVMVNMITITLAGKLIPYAQKIALFNSLVIIALLAASFLPWFNKTEKLATF